MKCIKFWHSVEKLNAFLNISSAADTISPITMLEFDPRGSFSNYVDKILPIIDPVDIWEEIPLLK